jgi:hypothetical protein
VVAPRTTAAKARRRASSASIPTSESAERGIGQKGRLGVRPPRQKGRSHVTLGEVIDESFLRRYRELLDAEDKAFDELEHAYEDGDRVHFEQDLSEWQHAINRKLSYLQKCGVHLNVTVSV